MRFAFWRRKSRNRELDEEIRAHLSLAERAEQQSGRSPQDVGSAARREFGNVAEVEELTRRAWGFAWLHDLTHDLRYAFRMLRKNPGFTAVAVATLALGIGVNTTLFTAFDAVALKPLPVKNPRSVMRLTRWFESGAEGDIQNGFSYPEYLNYLDRQHSFSALVAVSWPTAATAVIPAQTLAQGILSAPSGAPGEPERWLGQLVSANYFSELGIAPLLGRMFLPDEDAQQGGHPVIVLSYPCWSRRFQSDPQIVGKQIELNGISYTVIGVAPQEFIGTANPPVIPDFWAPLSMQPQLVTAENWINEPLNRRVQILGRLAPGVSRKTAQAETQVLGLAFCAGYRETDKTTAFTLVVATYFGQSNDFQFRVFVAALMLVVGMILLTACANLANMLLARATVRMREIAVRRALGATRSRLVRQLLTESVLIALLGGAAGFLVSLWTSRALWVSIGVIVRSLFAMDPNAVQMTPDIRVMLYTLLIALFTGIVFGLSPALRSSRADVSSALKDGGSAFALGVRQSRFRTALIATQAGVSVLFLVASGILLRGLVRSQVADPGFETKSVYGFGLQFVNDPKAANSLAHRVVDQIRSLPGVESVGIARSFPLTGTWTPRIIIEQTNANPSNLPQQCLANYASRGLFPTLGIRIVAGRNFDGAEDRVGGNVAIVSESAARTFWPGESPLGKLIKLDLNFRNDWHEFQVVGIAADVRSANLTRLDPGFIYVPTDESKLYTYALLLRSQRDSTRTSAAVRTVLEEAKHQQLPGFRLVSLEESVVRVQRLMPQVFAWITACLAFLALVLAAIGIYGVASYAMTQRTREIGIRIALGASPSDVMGLLLRDGLRPVLIGGACGMMASIGVASLLRASLAIPGTLDISFGAGVLDPLTFAVFGSFLLIVALAACLIPARRAMRVDPIVALRYE
ncbi:MAG TPA: ABC transporter permease [Candidatus Acidoferrales bacterium]|nr:ABC transporter permease [Candidatus Acidoferrales bacterium]